MPRPALACAFVSILALTARGAEPDPKKYWDVGEVRAGMKGTGQTVMTGTTLERFDAEVLGVMKDVSPGRDMILCKLSGCKLEHSGIIQGMSGSPIYVDGKLLGAVAYAWEFGKDPIAGVTPFSQMVQYVRSRERRVAAEGREILKAQLDFSWESTLATLGPKPVSGGSILGMKPIATPLAASGFSARALSLLSDQLAPIGLAPMSGGKAQEEILKREGDKPLVPGSPLSVAMVTGDFDLSGIGTVTHVEGDRVYGFGHPMFGLGACEFPMMTGYIHTVYPRASVSMKMGSPLKTVGVLDADVSTAVSGRLGAVPDLMPLSVKVSMGRYSEPKTYRVQVVREPNLMSSLVLTVLTNAIDTEGNLPDELTAKVSATIRLKDHDPITFSDTHSGPRVSGPMGPLSLFGPISSAVSNLVRNPLSPVRIESIECVVDMTAGRNWAEVESARLGSDRIEPGGTLKVVATLKPFKGERETVPLELAIPADFPEGTFDAVILDQPQALRRRFRNEPQLTEPRDVDGLLRFLRLASEPKRTSLYLCVSLPDRGLSVSGQALPHLPASARAVLSGPRETAPPAVRSDLTSETPTRWAVEGSQVIRFTVAKDAGVSLRD